MSVTYPVIQFLLDSGTIEFSRTQVISAHLIEQNNSISTELPIDTIEFKIISTDGTFSMFSDTFSLLKEKLPILVYENIDGTNNLIGKFYLDKWKNPSKSILEFTASNIIGVLADIDFDGIFWQENFALEQIMQDVFYPINFSCELDSSLANVVISGYIPAGTYREALQHIAFAAGATVVSSRRTSPLMIKSNIPELFYTTKIKDNERLGKESPIELLPLISSIELVSHNYTQGTNVETIFDKYLDAGSYKIVFEKPYYSVVISGPGYTQSVLGTEGGDYIGTENGDYIEAGGEYNLGPNAIYLTISAAGQVTITGYPWIDSKRSYVFNETGIENSSNKNTLTIADATLVNTNNGQVIIDNVRDYYRQRYLQKVKLLPTFTAKINDVVLSNAIYGNKILASVIKMDIDLTKGFLAQTDIRGLVPAYIPPATNPVRYVRAGIAKSGAGLTRNNSWRNYL
jgi:hypothetical protein